MCCLVKTPILSNLFLSDFVTRFNSLRLAYVLGVKAYTFNEVGNLLSLKINDNDFLVKIVLEKEDLSIKDRAEVIDEQPEVKSEEKKVFVSCSLSNYCFGKQEKDASESEYEEKYEDNELSEDNPFEEQIEQKEDENRPESEGKKINEKNKKTEKAEVNISDLIDDNYTAVSELYIVKSACKNKIDNSVIDHIFGTGNSDINLFLPKEDSYLITKGIKTQIKEKEIIRIAMLRYSENPEFVAVKNKRDGIKKDASWFKFFTDGTKAYINASASARPVIVNQKMTTKIQSEISANVNISYTVFNGLKSYYEKQINEFKAAAASAEISQKIKEFNKKNIQNLIELSHAINTRSETIKYIKKLNYELKAVSKAYNYNGGPSDPAVAVFKKIVSTIDKVSSAFLKQKDSASKIITAVAGEGDNYDNFYHKKQIGVDFGAFTNLEDDQYIFINFRNLFVLKTRMKLCLWLKLFF